MMKERDFVIPFSGLKLGEHRFDFRVDNEFYVAFGYEEFNAADIGVHVTLIKAATMLELDFQAQGTVNVNCDITNEPFDLDLEGNLRLVVKFGEFFDDEDDEILILPHGEHQIIIAQYIYEMTVLAVPPKKVHPGVADGSLQSDVLERLEALRPKEKGQTTQGSDPRWEVLKKLITDK